MMSKSLNCTQGAQGESSRCCWYCDEKKE